VAFWPPRAWNNTAFPSGRPGLAKGSGPVGGQEQAWKGGPAAATSLAAMTAAEIEARVRAICMALPEVTERASHGSPAFFVGKQFVMLWPDGHHEHRFPHMWCAAPAGAQGGLAAAAPKRFFRPPYVGGRGWVGMRLDGPVDWDEVDVVCEDAYRTVAPKRLVALLTPGSASDPD
jgi:hypothetical protein